MKAKTKVQPMRVIVAITGGCFDYVKSSAPIDFSVIDYDNLHQETDPLEIKRIEALITEAKTLNHLDE